MSRAADYYDVVILPPAAIRRDAINISRRIAERFGSPLILNERDALPHISLYHVAVPRRSAALFKETLAQLARRTAPGVLQVSGVHIYREFGSIAIEVSRPEWLRRFYLKIIHRTEGLRDPAFDNHRAWGAERLSTAERRFINRYGTPLVGRYFIPHITVTALKDRNQLDLAAAMIKPPPAAFKVESLHVCLQGEHHTCRKALYELPLKGHDPASPHRAR